jgi:predicted Zn-dependent protease
MLAALLALTAGAAFLAQRQKRQDLVSANALVGAEADWQRDLTRVPMHYTRISDAEEERIGGAIAQHYVDGQTESNSEQRALESYVNGVGARVAAHAHRTLDWQFHVIGDPQLVNAFALPGGQIFIGTGLLEEFRNEDELAFVLAHEIEHVDHYHPAERVQVEARLRHVGLQAIGTLAEIPLSIWQAGYTKDEELEADREGLRLAFMSGYSPQGAVELMQRFAALDHDHVVHASTPPAELKQVTIQGLTDYFRSHPPSSERLQRIQVTIAQDHLQPRPLTPFHLEYEITADGR